MQSIEVVESFKKAEEVEDSFLAFWHEQVVTLDPYPGPGACEVPEWPFLDDLAQRFQHTERFVFLKPRQIMASWLVAAYIVWKALYKYPAVVLVMSMGESEAQGLIGKCKFIYDHLPVKPPMERENLGEMVFDTINSRIIALPSTATAGTSHAASLVVCDEHAFHPYASTNWGAIQPTVSGTGGGSGRAPQMILLSSGNGPDTFHAGMYKGAKKGENGFECLFLPYDVRPDRDEKWYAEQYAQYPEGEKWLFRRQFPRTEEEALSGSTGVPFFGTELDDLVPREPMEREGYPLGELCFWQKPVVGARYVMGVDVSYGGEVADAGVAQVLDVRTGRHVARLWGRFPPEELAERAVELSKFFHRAYMGVEKNGVGVFALRKIQELGYAGADVQYYSDIIEARKKREKPKALGWATTQVTRPTMLADLREALRTRALGTECAKTLGEAGTFIYVRDNYPEHGPGAHDDCLFALAIAKQMIGVTPMDRAPITGKSYLGRG